MEFEVSPHELGACVFRPRRKALRRVREVAARVVEEAAGVEVYADGVTSVGVADAMQPALGAATWEALATAAMIPEAWVAARARRFEARRELRDAPTSVAMAVALASDPSGVATAEELAREVVARLAPWCAWRPAKVVWALVDPARWTASQHHGGGPWSLAAQCAVVALHRADDPARGMPASLGRALRRGGEYGATAHWDLNRAWLWRYAVELGLRLPDLDRLPAALKGRWFHELDDPFEPLLRLWSTGYALRAVTSEAVVLVAPTP